jgi:hypothetical protein
MEVKMQVSEEEINTKSENQMEVDEISKTDFIKTDTDIKINDDSSDSRESAQAEEFLNWCKNHKELKVNSSPTPIEDCVLHDVRIQNRFKEDSIFLHDKEIAEKIRRGNCVAEYKQSGITKYKIVRKGLIKFFDYLKTYKSSKKAEEKKVLDPVRNSFIQGKQVMVYITEKANGENLQIAYESIYNAWIVASKNVTIVVRDRNDLLFYKNQNEDKFTYCIEFAEVWFNILEREIINKSRLKEFTEDIKGYTLIGENVGFHHQHIKLYKENDLIFYGMIQNNSQDICRPVKESFEVFQKYNLSYVSVTKSEIFQNFDELNKYMQDVYIKILNQDVENGGEGSVAYFNSIDQDTKEEKVISMGKLKTFEYRFLRKLREKIRNLFSKKSKNTLSVKEILKKIERESKEILGEDGDESLDLSEWLKYGEFVLNFIKQYNEPCSYTELYATFTYEMKELYRRNKEEGLTINSCIVNNVCEKYKTKDKIKDENLIDTEITDGSLEKKILKSRDHNLDSITPYINPDLKENYISNLKNLSMKTFKKGGVYFFLNSGLVGGGKSTLFGILKKVIDTQFSDIINLLYISSDKMKEDMIKEYLKKNPNASFNKAFDNSGKNFKNKFNQEIINTLNNQKSDDKINIFYIDKNFPGKHCDFFFEDMQAYDKKLNYEITFFYPNIYEKMNTQGLNYPFSFNYFIQCYHRLRSRKHETLDFEKNENAHHILLGFLANFSRFNFVSEKYENKTLFYPLTFTDERQIEFSSDFARTFKNMMGKVGPKGFEPDHMKTCKDLIDKVFDHIHENFPSHLYGDTKPILEREIYDFLNAKIHGKVDY